MNEWASKIRAGDARALARAATGIENRDPLALETLEQLRPFAGHARIVGITGAPGAGKSTLVDALALTLRRRGKTVGDYRDRSHQPRFRRRRAGRPHPHAAAPRRSGRLHPLHGHARFASAAWRAPPPTSPCSMDAAGRDYVVIETVGVGQDEIEIAGLAQITVVVLVPGMGDDVQALKAGIMEIADVFVVNKADLPDANAVERDIALMLDLAEGQGSRPPVIRAVATEGTGIAELLEAVSGPVSLPRQSRLYSGELKLKAEIGIIGGSGLYSMPGFEAQEEVSIETPFGRPSENFVVGKLWPAARWPSWRGTAGGIASRPRN